MSKRRNLILLTGTQPACLAQLAVDFASRGIRCNAICPGTIDTPSLQTRMQVGGEYSRARRDFEAKELRGASTRMIRAGLGPGAEVTDRLVVFAIRLRDPESGDLGA